MEDPVVDTEQQSASIPSPETNQFSGAVSSLLIMIAIGIGFVMIGPLIGILVAIPFMNESVIQFLSHLSSPATHPQIKTGLLVLQACVTFIGLAAFPALYWWGIERKNPLQLFKSKHTPLVIVLVTVILVITFMPVNALVIQWNMDVIFPDFLGGFDSWARTYEKKNEELISIFTSFDSTGEFIFVFFTISILAGFSEELAFRGMLMPQLQRTTGNIHAAIWITAILFSAFHLQFFGFVPRVLLGALFGYLYYWSGDLRVSMLAHMVNNGVSVLALLITQKTKINVDLENQDVPIPAVIIGAIFTTYFLYYFYSFFKKRNSTSIELQP